VKATLHTVREGRGEPLRSVPFAAAFADNPSLCDRLAQVVAAIKANYLTDAGWRFRVHEASITFQQFRNRHYTVKILIDVHNELARKAGIAIRRNPIVVGLELTHVNAFVRESIRDGLASQFGDYYLDPRRPRSDSLEIISNDKYWIAPHNDHFYDMVFLGQGSLPVKAAAEKVEEYKRRILAGLGLEKQLGSDL
jgi:hypothetical protein